jgi:ankyrin repeat protein
MDGEDAVRRSPLHAAAAAGRADIVAQMLQAGCDASKTLQEDFPAFCKVIMAAAADPHFSLPLLLLLSPHPYTPVTVSSTLHMIPYYALVKQCCACRVP